MIPRLPGKGLKMANDNTSDMSHVPKRTLSTSVTSSRVGTSSRRWKNKTVRAHAKPRADPPVMDCDKRRSNAATEMIGVCRAPMAAAKALPPSRRKIGRRFNADATNPEYPTVKSGCIGTGCAAGSMIVLEAMQDSMDPTKKLDFSLAAVMNGNVDSAVVDAIVVILIPANMHAKDARIPAKGPESAKSNSDARLAGNDLSGVMHP